MLWASILAVYSPTHFTVANLRLLETFCIASDVAEQCDAIVAHDGLIVNGRAHVAIAIRAGAWHEMRACATKLRLSISTLQRADSAQARPDAAHALKKPWQ